MKNFCRLLIAFMFVLVTCIPVSAKTFKDIIPDADIQSVNFQVSNITYKNENGEVIRFYTHHYTENADSINLIMDALCELELVECEKGNPVSGAWFSNIEIVFSNGKNIKITGGLDSYYDAGNRKYFSKHVLYINGVTYEISIFKLLELSQEISEIRKQELEGGIIYNTGMPDDYNYRLRLNELDITEIHYTSKSAGQGIPAVLTPEYERNNMNVSFDDPEAIELFIINTDYIPLKLLGEEKITYGGDLGYRTIVFTTDDGKTETIDFHKNNYCRFNYRGKSYEIEGVYKDQFIKAVELAYEVENSTENTADKVTVQTNNAETTGIDYFCDVVKIMYNLITKLFAN